jgi:rhodanese-related sulfurtransferase
MEDLLPFLREHWVLSSILVVIVLLLLINEWRHRTFGLKKLDPQEVVSFMNHKSSIVIDIRAADIFSKGHILGAHNIEPSELQDKLKKYQKYKSKPVILVCAQGLDAPKIGSILLSEGFEEVYLMSGGLHAWTGQGLPLAKK